MYTCGMCKRSVDGEAALKNRAGSFCAECKVIIHARSIRGVRERSRAWDGKCGWCRQPITKGPMQPSREGEHVCYRCDRNRKWLLKAIRLSDHPALYVARTEERERPMREERAKAEIAVKQEIAEESAQSDAEARLLRLERMLKKLTQALGV